MEKKAIIFWRDKYNKEEDLYNKGEEDELREKFKRNRCMTKDDLVRIVKWKFQERLVGRQKRVLAFMGEVDDKFVKDLSRLAFQIDSDVKRIKLFCIIDGVGPALASVILTFHNPEDYGVFDIHVWRELFGKEPQDLFTNIKHVIRYFEELRTISNKVKMPARDVEKALFKKNYDESKS